MSYNPATGLVYFPVLESWIPYQLDDGYKPEKFRISIGTNMSAEPSEKNAAVRAEALTKTVTGHLLAYDPVKQKEVWRVPYSGGGAGGTVTTAGNLVFEGTGEQQFVAYRATDGKKLWEFDAQTVPMAGPMTYSVGGEQYVAVQAGGATFGFCDGAAAAFRRTRARVQAGWNGSLAAVAAGRAAGSAALGHQWYRKNRFARGRRRIPRRARNVTGAMP